MKAIFRFFYCKEFFLGTILINFFFVPSYADVDDRSDKTLESRLHNIYEKHYSHEVLDADWFKAIQAVQEQTYAVKKGDTLWGISTLYFGDGNYWSKLWSVNKNITNPHLIFNGDRISFTTGSFNQPPSITVTTNGAAKQTISESNESAVDEAAVSAADDSEAAAVAPGIPFKKGSEIEGPNDLPKFFKPPYNKYKRSTNLTSIVSRPEIIPSTDITLTQEVLSAPPQTPCRVKSVGINRVVTGEDDLVVLDCREEVLSIGSSLSILDSNIEEIQDGHIVKVLAVVKVRRLIGKGLYEALVTQQYDAILTRSLVARYNPSIVSTDDNGEVKEIPIKILNADTKSIWTSGDFIFMKMIGTPGNVGDILNFSNKYDYNINSFQRTALVKVVSTQPPFATGVVINSKSALDEQSVSAPVDSDGSAF